jgi:hypothetical protein
MLKTTLTPAGGIITTIVGLVTLLLTSSAFVNLPDNGGAVRGMCLFVGSCPCRVTGKRETHAIAKPSPLASDLHSGDDGAEILEVLTLQNLFK